MNHLKLYQMQEEYLAEKPNLPYPCVSYVKDIQKVEYIKKDNDEIEIPSDKSFITAKFKINQLAIENSENNGKIEYYVYGNTLDSIKSYTIDNETFGPFETPIYEFDGVKNIEYEEVNIDGIDTYAPKIENSLYNMFISTSDIFTANRELNLDNDYIIETYYWDNIAGWLNIYSLREAIEWDFFVLNEDNKSVSYSQYYCYLLNSDNFNGTGNFNISFCSIEDIDLDTNMLKQVPSIQTEITNYKIVNNDKIFNGFISVPCTQNDLDRVYDITINYAKLDIDKEFEHFDQGTLCEIDLAKAYHFSEIRENEFNNYNELSAITLCENTISIGHWAFYATNLISITCNALKAPSILNTTFSGVDDNGILYYPKGSDYSSWMQTNKYYLGHYGWASEEIDVITDK